MSFFNKDQSDTTTQAEPRRSQLPRYEINENPDAFTVTAFVPGVDRSALETQLDGDKLTVSASGTWKAPEDWTQIYRETSSHDYKMVLVLDHRVNREAIRAELNQGVLTLTLPKSDAVKPRRIEIQG